MEIGVVVAAVVATIFTPLLRRTQMFKKNQRKFVQLPSTSKEGLIAEMRNVY